MEEKFTFRRLALALHARPIHGKGDAPHEQRLPQSLLQNDTLCLEHNLLTQVGVGGGARLRHQAGDVAARIAEELSASCCAIMTPFWLP